jgi:hypothetical protein
MSSPVRSPTGEEIRGPQTGRSLTDCVADAEEPRPIGRILAVFNPLSAARPAAAGLRMFAASPLSVLEPGAVSGGGR